MECKFFEAFHTKEKKNSSCREKKRGVCYLLCCLLVSLNSTLPNPGGKGVRRKGWCSAEGQGWAPGVSSILDLRGQRMGGNRQSFLQISCPQ